MAGDFNTESMLDMYLFENSQLLEQLQETVLEQKDADCFDEDSINEIFSAMHTLVLLTSAPADAVHRVCM